MFVNVVIIHGWETRAGTWLVDGARHGLLHREEGLGFKPRAPYYSYYIYTSYYTYYSYYGYYGYYSYYSHYS